MTVSQILLAPLSGAYGAAVKSRQSLYDAGLFRRCSLAAPVISVGNLTTGGTGKTPLVEWLARVLARDYGLRVCILTRGYGRRSKARRIVVSNGEQLLADATHGGDEPRLLAEKLLGSSAVISDRDRGSAGEWAMANLGSNAFILDDGFQHLRLARILDLLTIDATNPFSNGQLLPRGNLREPLSAIRRADCIILTRAEPSSDVSGLRSTLDRIAGGVPILSSCMHSLGLRRITQPADQQANITKPLSRPVAAFCGVGNPGAFFSQLESAGHKLSYTRAFPDHHFYSTGELELLIARAKQSGAGAVVTTAKDAVKLGSFAFGLPCYVLEIELRLNDEGKLLNLIESAIKAAPAV